MRHVLNSLTAATAAGLLLFAPSLQAAEGGADYYIPGVYGNFGMALIPEPGIYLLNYTIYQEGKIDKALKYGELHEGLRTDIIADAIAPVWVSETTFFGGNFLAGLSVVGMGLQIQAGEVEGGPGVNDTNWGMGDPTLVPFGLAWKGETWDVFVYELINAPWGEYDVDDTSNLGLNYWAFDTNLSATYKYSPHISFDLNAGYLTNLKNDDTNYKTGSSVHFDWTAEYDINETWQVGLQGYYYKQIEGDSGSGATLGNFKGEAWGMGPAVQILFNAHPVSLVNLSYIHDFDTTNRTKDDVITLFMAWEF